MARYDNKKIVEFLPELWKFRFELLQYLVVSLLFSFTLLADFMPSIFGSYADQRLILSITLLLFVALGGGLTLFKNIQSSLSKVLWPFLLLLSSFIYTLLLSTSQPFFLVEPIFYVLFFLGFGLMGSVLGRLDCARELARTVVLVSIVSCFFYAAMTITVYFYALGDGFSRLDHVIPWGFVNIRYWSHVATWLIPLFPLGMLLVPRRDNHLWRLGVTFTAATWWWIVFMSASRGSIVSVVFGMILVWVVYGRAALPWVRYFVKFLLYGMVTWFFLSVLIPGIVFEDIQVRGLSGDSSGRMSLWREAWAMSVQNFPFGMGPQSWLTHDILTESYRASPKFGHPHNMYLMWAAEYGWISIAGLFVLVCYACRHALLRAFSIRKSRDPEGLWLIAFTASVTAALTHAGVSAVFIAPGSMMVGLVILTVFWSLITPETGIALSGEVRGSYSRVFGGVLVVVFLVVGALWLREVVRYHQAMSEDLHYYQNELKLGHLPRFWFHGNFPRHPSQMP